MARTKEINGETWTEVGPSGSNRWQGPDADPASARTDANGYGRESIVLTGDGFAVRVRGWVTATTPLTPKQHDTRSILANPARRADWYAERRAENRARAFQIASRRREAIALDTRDRFVDALVAAGNVGPVARVPVPHVAVTPRRRKVWHRMTSAMVILSEINRDYRVAIDDQSFGAVAFDHHRNRARTMFSPVARAAARTRQANRLARIKATETDAQREARLEKQRAKMAATRARQRAARLASTAMLTAEDAAL